MAASDLINLSGLIDDAKCFALVRRHRWPLGVRCPVCDSGAVIRDGHDDTQPYRQRYRWKACSGHFDDLTGTVLAGHPPAAARVGAVPLLYRTEPFKPANCFEIVSGPFGRAGYDGTATPRLGHQSARGDAQVRSPAGCESIQRDRRGLCRDRAQGPAGDRRQKGSLDDAASWQGRRAAARWRRTNQPSSV